jgi:hypothetical protein
MPSLPFGLVLAWHIAEDCVRTLSDNADNKGRIDILHV